MKRQSVIVVSWIFIFSLFHLNGFCQKPSFNYNSKNISGDIYKITINIKIPYPWHLYSMLSPANGPTPMKITFNNHPLIKFEGDITEKGKRVHHYEEVFDLTVKYYQDSVEYCQIVKLSGGQRLKTNVTGTIEYMLCTSGMCLPPTKEKFSIVLQ